MSGTPLKIIITSRADKDETAIYEYIQKNFGKAHADKFRARLLHLLQLIAQEPFVGRPAKNDVTLRVFIFSKQNKLVYKTTETEIIVIRILNMKLNVSGGF